MKIAYNHLVNHIQEKPSMEMISEKLFQLGHEHEIHGNIFDMEFTPNRGDCLSINGLLRDLAAFYTVDCKQNICNEKLDTLKIDFTNLSQDICPNISFLKIEVEEIPASYKGCLDSYFSELDLNKNNFFTDISNYISYETGQPTHCYDANKIQGKLIFQEVDLNCEFETLLGKKINLKEKNPVFFLNDEVINLAGVVGSKNTSCSKETTSVLVECAFFLPESIIGKSIKYDIQSEASHKFERSVDPKCHEVVIRRFIKLVSEHTKIKKMSFISLNYNELPEYKIPVNVTKINEIIGINLNENEYLDYLSKLGFKNLDGLITVPSYRSDVRNQNDLAEEIARSIGFDNINRNDLTIPECKKIYKSKEIENKLRYFLLDHGFYEVINFPFVNKDEDSSIKVDNPLDSNRDNLRINLKDSLLNNLMFNERRQKDSIKLFEISDIYTSVNSSIKKTRKIAIIASGRVGHNYEDFSKKITKHYFSKLFKDSLPSEEFDFQVLNRDSIDTKKKDEIVYFESNIENFSNKVMEYHETTMSPEKFILYRPVSDLPSSKRDLSFSIKDIDKCKALEKFILSYREVMLRDVFIFDFYNNEKKQEIKIGFRFVFQSQTATITDTEVDSIMNNIIKKALEFDSVSIPGLS
jgi:phenylalanyl-tRNA synthetase beta chain